MYNTESFVKQLTEKYPPHQGNKTHFDIKNIENFESELGTELPSDFYDFLLAYGSGSFNDYFYVWHPFTEGGADEFFQNNKQAEENYKFLENSLDASWPWETITHIIFSRKRTGWFTGEGRMMTIFFSVSGMKKTVLLCIATGIMNLIWASRNLSMNILPEQSACP